MVVSTLGRFLAAASLAALVPGGAALGAWTLEGGESEVGFISTKVFQGAETSATELNRFTEVSGGITDDGAANIEVDLASVDTNIGIRDQRMREHLFQVEQFPTATIQAQVPTSVLNGASHRVDLGITLTLHGHSETYSVPVAVAPAGDGRLLVNAIQPVLLDATTFDLGPGVTKLTELAGLLHIPTSVPVSFSLVFSSAGE